MEKVALSGKKVKYSFLIVGVFVWVLFLTSFLYADRTTTAAFLKLTPGARPSAIGGSYVSINDDAFSVYYNPASLAFIHQSEIALMHSEYLDDMNYEYAGVVYPLSYGSVIGLNFIYMDEGRLKKTTYSDPYGLSLGYYDANDYAIGISYAQKILDYLGMGGTVKFIKSKIEDEKATAFAVDFGINWLLPYNVSVGASISNLGTKMKFMKEKEDLPQTYRIGISKKLLLLNDMEFLFSVDAVKVKDDDVFLKGGIEFKPVKFLALRAGYDDAVDVEDGWTFGFGISLDNLNFDYAYSDFGELGKIHKVSTNFKFGKVSRRVKVLPVRYYKRRGIPLLSPVPPKRTLPPLRKPLKEKKEKKKLPPKKKEKEQKSKLNAMLLAYLNKAKELIKEKKFEEANVYLNLVLVYDEQNKFALYYLGVSHYYLKYYIKAKQIFEKLLNLYPDDENFMIMLGNVYFKLDDYTKAKMWWSKALEKNPQNKIAIYNLNKLKKLQK